MPDTCCNREHFDTVSQGIDRLRTGSLVLTEGGYNKESSSVLQLARSFLPSLSFSVFPSYIAFATKCVSKLDGSFIKATEEEAGFDCLA